MARFIEVIRRRESAIGINYGMFFGYWLGGGGGDGRGEKAGGAKLENFGEGDLECRV